MGELPEFDRDEVLAGVAALTRLAPTPREAFLLRNLEAAEAFAAEHFPGESVEAWIRRELFVGMAAATGVADADMVFGVGRDGTEPQRLLGVEALFDLEDDDG